MQNMLGRVRRCVDDYHMIEAGDSIAVGVSGGKDSLTLLAVLAGLRSFYPKAFSLRAITIDMGLDGMDFSPVAELLPLHRRTLYRKENRDRPDHL